MREEKALAESLGLCRGAEAAETAARAAKLEADLRSAKARVRELETVRRQLHNTIQARSRSTINRKALYFSPNACLQEWRSNIRVFSQVRPAVPGAPAEPPA